MKVFIQNEAGSSTKNFYNEKTLEPKGMTQVSRPYPWPYGFVIGTTGEDGMNVDCFVLSRSPLRTGEIVECDPIGLMEQLEDGKEDHNILAVFPGARVVMDAQLQEGLAEFVRHVFDHIPGKIVKPGKFLGKEEARKYLASHADIRAFRA